MLVRYCSFTETYWISKIVIRLVVMKVKNVVFSASGENSDVDVSLQFIFSQIIIGLFP